MHPFKFFAFFTDVFKTKQKLMKKKYCLLEILCLSLDFSFSLSLSVRLSLCVSKCVVFRKSWYAFAMFKECAYDMPTFWLGA